MGAAARGIKASINWRLFKRQEAKMASLKEHRLIKDNEGSIREKEKDVRYRN